MRALVNLTLRQKEVLTALAFVGVFGSGFLAGELGVRLLQMVKFGVARDVETSSNFYIDKATGLRLPRPDRWLGRVRINNAGFRGPDIAEEKGPETFRVAFLGSSSTYDPNVPEVKNWPHRVADLLDEATPGCRVEFINAGLPGYSTKHMQTYYESRIAAMNPDLVVILPGDINHDLDTQAETQGFSSKHYELPWLARHSVLWGKLAKNLEIIRRQRAAHQKAGKLRVDVPALVSVFERHLRELVDAIVKDGRSVAVVTIGGQLRRDQTPDQQVRAANTSLFYMPYVSIPDLLDVHDAYNETIRGVTSGGSAILLEGEYEVPGDRLHYMDSMHYTPAGSEKMGQRISRRLLAAEGLKVLMRQRGCIAN